MSNRCRLVTFLGENVAPLNDALIYDAAINGDGFFYGGELTIKNANTLHISAGYGIIAGREFEIVDSDIALSLTTGGTHKGRVYMHLDLSNTADPCDVMTQTGTSISPPQQDPNVNIFNGIYEFDMAYFDISQTTISNLQVVTPYVDANGILSTIADPAESPTTKAYREGEYFVYNGRLYVTTTAIAQGAELVVDTNIMKTTIESMVQQVSGIAPNPMKHVSAAARDGAVSLRMTPPDDTVVDGQYLAYVAGFRLVRKEGSIPQNEADGTLLFDLQGDAMSQYVHTPYDDTGLTNGTTYYYRWFPYSVTGTVNSSLTGNTAHATPQPYNLFGFHYSENDSSPASVTYPADVDNASFTPFSMNLTTGVPDYGDWDPEDPAVSWLFPKSCMLKYDGTVDYYLDENDETKKADGTASDVTSTAYAGNAMMEWGQNGRKIYWKVVPDADGKGFTFYVANAQVDSSFEAWNHYNANGQLVDHFYTPKYFGSHDGTRLRSISGAANYVNTAGTNEIAKAKANNPSGSAEMWNIENWCDRFLIWMLLVMMGKNMNTKEVYGQGRCASGNTSAIGNNTLNGKGMFCGYSNQTSDVKVFGMQGWWGNLWRRCNGLINDRGTVKIKLTYGQQDGSTVDGYNTDGSGYINHGTIGGGTSGGSISHCNITEKGITPNTMSGAGNTYYCDGGWFNNGQNNFAVVGGRWNNSALVGAGCVNLRNLVSTADTGVGAAPSCKPLA